MKRRNLVSQSEGDFILNGMRMQSNFTIPRGKMIVQDNGDGFYDPHVWPKRDYRFQPVCFLHPEDYLEQALALQCWDAALETVRKIVHQKIISGQYGKGERKTKIGL